MKRPLLMVCILLFLVAQPACIWRLWKKKPIEQRVFDVYGTVKTVTADELVVETEKKQELQFRLAPSSIKGSDFSPGTYVHVYYKIKGEVKEITMVVEKIN